MLSVARLRELLSYDPETGVFTWKARAGRWGRIPAGTAAGHCSHAHGYTHITIDSVLHKAHRLAWLYMTGEWPEEEIDHINRIRDDNRFSNLRECSLQENLKNKNRYRSNTSGFPGVTWHKRIGQWQARISNDTQRHHLGYFESAEAANTAYLQAKSTLHEIAA